jgi:hypothetical protein
MRLTLVALVGCSAAAPPPSAQPSPSPSPSRCVNGRYDQRKGPPRAELGSAGDHVQGDLDRNLVRRAVADHAGELQACYASYLERGALAGRVNARFTIVGDGHVGDAWVTGFDDALANCVCEVVVTMQFLPTRGGAITVTYPFSFAPSGGA